MNTNPSSLIKALTARWDELVVHDTFLTDPDAVRLAMQARGLVFGERSLLNVARPRFATRAEIARTQQTAAALARALTTIWRRLWAAHRSGGTGLPGFDEWISRVAECDPLGIDNPTGRPGTVLRMDSYSDGASLGVIELNADVPEGAILLHGIRRVFQISDTWPVVAGEFHVAPIPLQRDQDRSLFAPWRGGGRPKIGIVGWVEGAEAVTEKTLADHLRMHGYTTIVAEPGKCVCDNGRFVADGTPVDIVYRLCHLPDMLKRPEETAALFEATRKGIIPIVNPLSAELFSHKYLLSVLHHEPWCNDIATDDRILLESTVPWGAVVSDSPSSTPDGHVKDLSAWISTHRENLVLKAAHGQGGMDVVLGWTVTQAQWDTFLKRLLVEGGVVQSRLVTPRASYPLVAPGAPQQDFYYDTVAFIFDGVPGGIGSRLSRAEITNVSQGGSIVPVFMAGS
jgi:hypothetical protein